MLSLATYVPLSLAARALLLKLPDAPSDGLLCKGPRLNTANALARRGLARCVGINVSLYYFVRTDEGRRAVLGGAQAEKTPVQP